MSAESNARSHAQSFSWWRGCPDLTGEEAELRDLLALRKAVEGLIAERQTNGATNQRAGSAARS